MLEAVIVTIWFELADGTLRHERLGRPQIVRELRQDYLKSTNKIPND